MKESMAGKEIDVYLTKSIEYGFENIYDYDPTRVNNDLIVIGMGKAVIHPVDTDCRQLAAEALQKKKKKMMADHQLQIEKIEEQIQSLLAIGHDSALETDK